MGHVMHIGRDNVFEIGSGTSKDFHLKTERRVLAETRARRVGDNNVVEVQSQVGELVELSTGCVIGVRCAITARGTLPPNTVIHGEQNNRRIAFEPPLVRWHL